VLDDGLFVGSQERVNSTSTRATTPSERHRPHAHGEVAASLDGDERLTRRTDRIYETPGKDGWCGEGLGTLNHEYSSERLNEANALSIIAAVSAGIWARKRSGEGPSAGTEERSVDPAAVCPSWFQRLSFRSQHDDGIDARCCLSRDEDRECRDTQEEPSDRCERRHVSRSHLVEHRRQQTIRQQCAE